MGRYTFMCFIAQWVVMFSVMGYACMGVGMVFEAEALKLLSIIHIVTWIPVGQLYCLIVQQSL